MVWGCFRHLFVSLYYHLGWLFKLITVQPDRAQPLADLSICQVVFLRQYGGEQAPSSVLAPKVGPLGMSPKKVGDDACPRSRFTIVTIHVTPMTRVAGCGIASHGFTAFNVVEPTRRWLPATHCIPGWLLRILSRAPASGRASGSLWSWPFRTDKPRPGVFGCGPSHWRRCCCLFGLSFHCIVELSWYVSCFVGCGLIPSTFFTTPLNILNGLDEKKIIVNPLLHHGFWGVFNITIW